MRARLLFVHSTTSGLLGRWITFSHVGLESEFFLILYISKSNNAGYYCTARSCSLMFLYPPRAYISHVREFRPQRFSATSPNFLRPRPQNCNLHILYPSLGDYHKVAGVLSLPFSHHRIRANLLRRLAQEIGNPHEIYDMASIRSLDVP